MGMRAAQLVLANAVAEAVAAERERCAKIADEVQKSMHDECDFGAGMVATAIRAQPVNG